MKHLIESLRIPHTEVGKIIVNGSEVDFSYIVKDDDRIEVYPARSDPTDRINMDTGKQDIECKFINKYFGDFAYFLSVVV